MSDKLREAALAELAIKESLTVAKQEPVGQMQESAYGRGQVLWFNKPADQSMLYVAPPRREWVGLTDEDWATVEDMPDAFDQGVAWAAARLQEKNT